MKLILSKTIVEVEQILFATVGLQKEDSRSEEGIDFAKELLYKPFWMRLFIKLKYFLFGYPSPRIVPIKSWDYKIMIEYMFEKSKFTLKLTYSTEREAAEEFAAIKDFVKKLENKHAMDIISK